MDKLAFAGTQYAALSLFVLACWGLGGLVLRRLLVATPMRRWLAHGLCLCCGMGLAICVLQWLAVAGLLVAPALLALLVAGLVAAGWQALRPTAFAAVDPAPLSGAAFGLHWTVWLLLLLGAGTVLFPLRPPYLWDELAYHLPHAREWASTGTLQVNAWLRYPWSPFNYHLLYAAALVLCDDITPHLLHALAGWTTALLLYQLALRQTSRIVACVATIGWLALARADFGNAYIDLALAMFLLAGWASFMLWWQSPPAPSGGWLIPAAFLLGVAAGIKYQMLGFLPFFVVAVLLRERRPKTLWLALGAGLLPCGYWYLRNALLTGDPFNPLGGSVLGYHDWDAGDLRRQLLDLSKSRNWPHPLLWPAMAAPLLPSIWRDPRLRMAMLFCAFAFVVWFFTSHFARYLLPVYPLLSLLAGYVVWGAVARVTGLLRARLWPAGAPSQRAAGRIEGVVAAVLLVLSVQTTARSLGRDWSQVAATPAQRAAFLDRQLSEYRETLGFLRGLRGARIYQNGMEGALYYAPHPIWGDHFGPWRYADFVQLPPAGLAEKLVALDLDTLVLRLQFNRSLRENAEFPQCFELLHADHTFGVYRVRSSLQPDGSRAVCRPAAASRFVIGPALPPAPQ